MSRSACLVPVLALAACSGGPEPIECGVRPLQAPGATTFVDISATSGIQLGNFAPAPTMPIPINDHSRIAFVDLDGDHCDDIVAHDLFPNPKAGIPFTHLAFHNNCDGTFTDDSERSGLANVQAGFFAFGDIDNDGDQDAFAGLDIPLPGLASSLWLNDGTGHFTPKLDAGIEGALGNTSAANAVFADFDGDAKLDLFVGNGQTSYAAKDALFLGNGDGTFRDGSARLTNGPASPSNGSTTCDYDNDGDLDILVSVYGVSLGGAQNILWQNDGAGTFTNVAVASGFASLPTGNYWITATGMGQVPEPSVGPGAYVGSNGFGLACEDIDNDGDLDIAVSAISHPGGEYSRTWSDPSVLLLNTGASGGYTFENAWLSRGLPYNEGDVDLSLVDFDNDGRLDIGLSRTDKYEMGYVTEPQKGWFGLMHQQADGSFAILDRTVGLTDEDHGAGTKGAQNHAWADIDRDGDLDLLIGARDQGGGRANLLFRNDLGSQHHWLAVAVVGDGVHVTRDAIGARVTLRFADGTTQTREVKSGRGTYNGTDTRLLHFGLGEAGCDYVAEVTWPDGTVKSIEAGELGVDAVVTVAY